MGHLSLWSSKNLTRLLVVCCYFPETGWMWCGSHLFVISPNNQMISSKPPDSPMLRPERPKLFPCSPFLSPGSCLRATGNSNATFPLPTFSRSSTTSQKSLVSLSLPLSLIFFLLLQSNGNSVSPSESSAIHQTPVCSPKSRGCTLSSPMGPKLSK